MLKAKAIAILTISVFSVASFTGCTTSQTSNQTDDVVSSTEYRDLQRELAAAKVNGKRTAELEAELARLQTTPTSSRSSSLLPPNPKPGECYARVVIPAKYKTATETVQVRAPSTRIETTEPTYKWVEQRVLVSEASSKLEIVPATYKTVTETVEVSAASERLERIPATYKTVTEKVLISPARTEWKKGTGPIQRIDSLTGEIMCLVEIPAQYRTISNRVVDIPESVRKIDVPAKTDVVTRRVVDQPATTRTVEIPAAYKTIKVRQLATPAAQKTIEIPGETSTITKRMKVEDSYLEWRSILCETNTTPDVIRRLQSALNSKGFNPGPIDGFYGAETQAAVNRYQEANKLAAGQLTIDTLRKLNVL